MTRAIDLLPPSAKAGPLRASSDLGRAGLFAFVALCLFAVLSPFSQLMPGFGLDPSYQAVLGEAPTLGLRTGQDVIATGGPLSPLYTRWFDADRFWLYLGLHLGLITTVALGIATLAGQHNRFGAAAVLSLGTVSVIDLRDALFFCIPVLTALVVLSQLRSRIEYVAVWAGLMATAVAALAKFSTFPPAMVGFLVADGVLVSRRQVPFLTVGFLAIFFGTFAVLEGAGSFLPFVRGSFIVSAGYTDAMGIAGPVPELLAYLCGGAVALAAMGYCEVRALRDRRTGWLDAAARGLIIGVLVFISFKGGFVRQDIHTIIAWSGLALAALIYVLVAPPAQDRSGCRGVRALIGGLGLLVAFIGIPLVWQSYGHYGNAYQTLGRWRGQVAGSFDLAAGFIGDPSAWIAQKQREKEAGWAKIRQALPLPDLDGTVDAIPGIQSSILAHGLRYKPRWSFQEQGTYTRQLIDRNRSDVVGDGPNYMLFDPALMAIDTRYPALAEGALWPDLLRLYALVSHAGSVLVLKRRDGNAPHDLLGPAAAATVRFGEPLAIQAGEPRFLRVHLEKTLVGKLASVLFRPSLVQMRVTFADGEERAFRIIPEIARAGFVVSPYIGTADDYGALLVGHGSGLRKVARVVFETGRLGPLLYAPTIAVDIRAIRMDEVRQLALADPGMRNYVNEQRYMMLLRASPGTSVIPEGLLAHAPKTLVLRIERPAASLTVGYGIVDAASKPPATTDGVCFAVSRRRGSADTPLFSRCLTPGQTPGDQGQQTSRIDVDLQPGDVVQLETICRDTCDYDWSYWSKVIAE